jgi:hypothetical protein
VAVDGIVDFYVAALTQFATSKVTWLVCKDTLVNCVGVQDDFASATAQAIRMAEYHAQRGLGAQVHVQARDSAQWRTLWTAPGVDPRFP